MIEFRVNKSYDFQEVMSLYASVGWTNYTRNPEMLTQALKQSLYLVMAYDGDNLVGLLRAVGDGVSIVFVQDILVFPDYQRQGIGSQLLQNLLGAFPTFYQMHLLTDRTQKTKSFYESQGFQPVEEVGCAAFTLKE